MVDYAKKREAILEVINVEKRVFLSSWFSSGKKSGFKAVNGVISNCTKGETLGLVGRAVAESRHWEMPCHLVGQSHSWPDSISLSKTLQNWSGAEIKKKKKLRKEIQIIFKIRIRH
jgi:ABC-type microcin C transport system duplicated ATPase subunit YejF